MLPSIATYFEEAHPRLHGDVVGDLYEQLDGPGRAEETLAFLVGAVASRHTRTVAPARALREQGLHEISEPVLTSDVELLIRLGLLSGCMDPGSLGHRGVEITFGFYRAAWTECS